ncbi:MAG: group 1 glycosyl transferase [Fimbriimonadales bacterium]|nr:MAG: group 1 glycosyl transferase [Fimbriimonadales bacterium]
MRIAFLRKFHANRWFSGAQIQAIQTAEALRRLGLTVDFIEDAERSDYDLLHVFGLYPEYRAICEAFHAHGIPIAASPIFFKDCSTLFKRAYCATAPVWGQFNRAYGAIKQLLAWVDALLPNTQAEAQFMRRYFRWSGLSVVVPNGVAPRFAEGDPHLFRERFGITDEFVLCVGRIERRKNQLRLVQALRGTGIPLVILGDSIAHKYLARCQRAADANVRFLPMLPHDSPLLVSAYAACRVFALPSLLETPGLAALEAGVSGARVVVTPYGGAPEYFQQFARYPNPRSAASIRAAILEAWESPHAPDAQRQFLLNRYSWEQVAQETLSAYRCMEGIAAC